MTDSSTGRRTREREEVQTVVETTEVVEFQCANCEQWFGGGEMVGIGIGPRDATNRQPEQSQLCEHCADGLFDYDGAKGLEQRTYLAEDEDSADAGVGVDDLTSILIPIVVTGIIGYVGLQVTNAMVAEIDESEFQEASQQVATSTGAEAMFELTGVLFIVIILALIAQFLIGGPRL